MKITYEWKYYSNNFTEKIRPAFQASHGIKYIRKVSIISTLNVKIGFRSILWPNLNKAELGMYSHEQFMSTGKVSTPFTTGTVVNRRTKIKQKDYRFAIDGEPF